MEGFMKGIAFVLASLLFLEACAGAVASQPKRVSSAAATAAEKTSDSTAPSDTQTSSARWPWFVAGGTLLAAAAVGLDQSDSVGVSEPQKMKDGVGAKLLPLVVLVGTAAAAFFGVFAVLAAVGSMHG
jgi:hypothetical protein